MDPAVKSAFEEIIRRFDSFDAKWEARFADAESARRNHDDETERRLAAVEAFTNSVPGPAARLSALEDYCSANSEAAVAAEEWNRGFSNRVGELEEKMDDLELIRFSEMRDERDDRVAALEDAAVVFDEWRPWLEASVHDIRLEIKRLKGVERSPATRTSSGRLGVAPFTESASARPPAGEKADWPNGHREQGYGSVTTLAHPAVHGTCDHPPAFPKMNPIPSAPIPSPTQFHPYRVHHPTLPPDPHAFSFHQNFAPSQPTAQFLPQQHNPTSIVHPTAALSAPVSSPTFHSAQLGRLPKLDFPKFDGDHAQFWITCAVNYFEMYAVEPSMWIRVATMHFTGAAKRWLQSIEHLLASLNWKSFCSLLHERFSRDQHELLLRQLFNIRQTGSVSEYIDKFTELIDQLKSYNPNPDTLAYTTRFINGLREDIRAVILVARPASLDAAYTLASLQEEAGGPVRTRDRRTDFSKFSAGRGGLGSPMPQGRMADDKPSGSKFSSPEDKLSSLKNFRRARGLCIRCGEKWAPGHKCSSQPQLHALQEVWELFQDSFQDEEEDPHSVDQEPAVDAPSHLFFTCSAAAVQGQSSLHTMQFSGKLLGHQVSILVDSGSSHSFISTATASLLSGHQPLPHPVSVKVANGDTILCETVIPDVEWSVQSYTFHSTFRVLPLGSYDIILGMDWLEAFSPMKVNWRNKWMSISYGSGSVLLHGLGDVSENCSSVMVFSISSDAVDQPTHTVHPQVQSILDEFSQLFAEPSALPPRRDCDHSIPLVPGAQPVCIRQYRYSPKLKSEIESQVSELLRTGMIRPSRSPFSSPVLLVKKKDQSWRMCVDYRMLNALTVKSKFPIPVIDELLDELAQARWFSCLDLRAGFNQIRMAPGEEYKTAFQTHWGHFEYNVMSFGLTGAPNTFQGAMNVTLKPLLRVCVIVFFDDILVYSQSWEQHLVHLRQVFELLQQDQWLVKLSKCRFAQESIAYLGHVISADGVSTDPSKLESIRSWPVPKDVKDLRSFLGLAGYYRKFVQHFAVIARPLYDLLKKGVVFCWTSTHSTAFSALQSALMSAPVLALPDFNKPFQIQTDASDTGVGAVLMQDGHPLAFVSKSLGPRTRGLSTYDKEYLAILVAVDQWRSYLQHNEFTIFTDQRSLIHVSDQRLHTPWQLKMYTRLAGLQYRVIYKPGTTNKAADALSRHPEAPSQLQAISSVTPTWLADVVTGYSSDPYASKLLQQLSVNPDSSPPYSLTGGIIRYKGRIWLGSNVPLHHRVMSALHNSALGGHSGFPVTYARIKQHFAWWGMKADIRNFVTTCSVCAQAKPDRSRYPGLLSPLPVPSSSWQVISMDFIDGLPTSGTANCILVIVDKFSKYAHFVPLHHPYTAGKVAQAFLDSVFKLHGLPTHIISDRDPVFTSAFWNELFRLAKVQLCLSSAYHPQSDGQTERVNQCLETYLRCFIHSCPKLWLKWLSLAEYWYNTSQHSALGRSPFEVLYGHPPKHFGLSDAVVSSVPDVESMLAERATMVAVVRQHLLRAQQRMKHQADKKRSDRKFNVGDHVYLRLQPYVQSSLAPRAHNKLCFKYLTRCAQLHCLPSRGSLCFGLRKAETERRKVQH